MEKTCLLSGVEALLRIQACPGEKVHEENSICSSCPCKGFVSCATELRFSSQYTLEQAIKELEKVSCEGISSVSKEDTVHETITNMLRTLGIPAHILGYRYLREALKLILKDPSYMNSVTKRLYEDVAKAFNTTNSRVERAIRHTIEIGWMRADTDLLYKIFGYSIDINKGKPTNSEFLATVAEHIDTILKY